MLNFYRKNTNTVTSQKKCNYILVLFLQFGQMIGFHVSVLWCICMSQSFHGRFHTPSHVCNVVKISPPHTALLFSIPHVLIGIDIRIVPEPVSTGLASHQTKQNASLSNTIIYNTQFDNIKKQLMKTMALFYMLLISGWCNQYSDLLWFYQNMQLILYFTKLLF